MVTIQQTGIRLTAEDKQAIETIKKHYALLSGNAAIRYALRAVMREIENDHQAKKSDHQKRASE